MYILVLNSGSSSLKFQIFQKNGKEITTFIKGIADAIGLSNSYIDIKANDYTYHHKTPLKNHNSALKKILDLAKKKGFVKNLKNIKLIGHRVVHGGEKYGKAVKLTPQVLKDIKELCTLAPLHNPPALSCIEFCREYFPKIKQIIVFDTAFHQTLKPLAFLYALPPELHEKHQIRRYGFHGINVQYISSEAVKLLKKAKQPSSKLIACHLGNGCSVTAIRNGKSVDTSMGFTPLEGLIMGTRSGDLDPALPLELLRILHLSPPSLNQYLNKKTGLMGITGLSSDIRIIRSAAQKGNKKAQLAMQMFCYRLAKYINSYIGVLGGADAIVFSGGIGEHAWYIRNETLKYLKHLNIKSDSQKNLHNKTFFQDKTSKTSLIIIPANEELEIARQALKTK